MIAHTAVPSAPILRREHREAVPVLFNTVLISEIDAACHSALPIAGHTVLPSSYTLRLHRFAVATAGSVLEAREVTMGKSDVKVAATLRHLLQAADPIPVFNEIPDGLNLEEFFTRYIWKRGPRATIAVRRDAVRSLMVTMRPFSETTVSTLLRKVTIDRKHELRILSLFSEILEIVAAIDDRSVTAQSAVERFFFYYALRNFWKENAARRRPFVDFIMQPALLADAYTAVVAALAASNSPCRTTQYRGELVYGFLSAHFSFDEFLKQRIALTAFDVRISQALSTPEPFIEKQFPVTKAAKPGKFDKHVWMAEQAEKLREKEDLLEIFRGAAHESNPIWKLREMTRALSLAQQFFSSNCPPTTELGADEFTPIMIGCVIFANPPYLFSNLIYIIEFCIAEQFNAVFDQILVQPITVLKVVVMEVMPEINLAEFARTPLGGLV
jgi:hypothetical protein